MGQTRPRKSPDDLRLAARDVRYEIATMFFAARCLGDGYASPASPPEGRAQDVLLESFLLHYRNLRDFLCPSLKKGDRPPADDDVLASDFLGLEAPQNMATLPCTDRTRINKMLAHISYTRKKYTLEGNDKWLVHTMCREMVKGLEEFLTRLAAFAPDRRAWFYTSKFLKRSLAAVPDELACGTTSVTTVSIKVSDWEIGFPQTAR
jgi:hypothetical protein